MTSNDLSMTFDHIVLKTPNSSHSMSTSSKLHQHPFNSVEKDKILTIISAMTPTDPR